MTQAMTPGRRIVLLVGLALALIPPCAGIGGLGQHIPNVPPMVGRELAWWGLAALVLLYVIAIERQPLRSLGFKRPTWRTFAFGFGGALVMLVGAGASAFLAIRYFHLTQNQAAYEQLANTPLLYRAALVTRAAVVEEILFRGYALERIQALTGNRWLAGLLSLAVFTYAHLSYWGWTQLIFAGLAGLVLTAMYLWRRDLPSNMLAHWLVDAAGFLLRG